MPSRNRKLKICAAALAVLTALLCACGKTEPAENAIPESFSPKAAAAEDHAREDCDAYCSYALAGMTLREKVGQMFIIRPDQLVTSIPPA
ncbi:MAG: hypothetical protein IIU22_00565, partial [Firmicutes bacterium]|nr:hypothetical protein [Bacillota bacterium]